VPLGELPGGHRYAVGYNRTDPVIPRGNELCPSFSAFLLRLLLVLWSDGEGVGERRALWANIGRGDARYGRLLLTDSITEDQGITADWRNDWGNLGGHARDHRRVIVSDFRPGETVAAQLWVA